MIKTHQMKYFLSVLDNKSFNLASEKLNISQPAISKAISDLEQILSVKLINRLPKGVEATEYGKILEKYSYLILNDISKVEKDINSLKEGSTGNVNIGVAFSPRIYLLPLAIKNLSKKYPKINFKVFASQRMDLMSSLIKGNIDLFVSAIVQDDILYLEGTNINTFEHLPLYKDTQHIVTRFDHPLQYKKNLKLSDTLKYDWILPDQEKTLRLFNLNEQFLKNKIDLPEPKILHNSGNFAISVIKSSNFIGIHPKQMIETQKDKLLKILDIQGISMEPIYGITFLKNKPLRRACQLIIDELSLTSNDMIKQGLVKKI